MRRSRLVWALMALMCFAVVATVFAATAQISIFVNGEPLRAQAIVRDGVTYLPVRAVAQALGVSVEYDQRARSIFIQTDGGASATPREALPPTASASARTAYLAQARKALQALQDVQSLVRAGIKYDDYCKRLGDARILVDRFLRAQPRDLAPPSRDRIEGTMGMYEAAAQFWSKQIECAAKGPEWRDLEARFKRHVQEAWEAADQGVAGAEAALSGRGNPHK